MQTSCFSRTSPNPKKEEREMNKTKIAACLSFAFIIFISLLTQVCAEEVIFWTGEVEQDRMKVQERMATQFMKDHPRITIKIVPVDENVFPEKLAAAKAGKALPDVVEIGLAQITMLNREGLLDVRSATQTIRELGVDSFYAGPLGLCKDSGGEGWAAVPIDGWVQGIWYRRDWFEEAGLAPPGSWSQILKAAKAFQKPKKGRFGIVIGTDPQQMYTQQVFEHFALSNGARLFDTGGRMTASSTQMAETFSYYRDLAKYGPPGNNYWREARQYYITDRVAMMFYSPYIIDDIAGLVAKYQPTVQGLASKTDFVPIIEGSHGDRATYGEIYALGILKGAKADAARKWIAFVMDQGYVDWLFMSPGGKVPTRKAFINQWQEHPYFSHYSSGMAKRVADGMEKILRWGFFEGQVRSEVADLYALKVVPSILERVFQGTLTPEDAALHLQERLKGFSR